MTRSQSDPGADAVIPTQIKDRMLVDRRRRQIVDAAVRLFIEKGFHKTTTREIAGASGMSIGLLYEYVASKEDILYLVCEAIHAEVERGVSQAMEKAGGGRDVLAEMIRRYFLVCHRMSNHILLIYQESRALPPPWRKRVLDNEVKITGIFIDCIKRLMTEGVVPRKENPSVELMAHNITVLGHMWTFRRWFLSRHYSIEEYTRRQTRFILKGMAQT
ncbi:MAG: TetR/AcrR family transcriptional regulator [Candidatus Aminicenantes bacterium]|nr:TetR/AcrR family transcriptional regulator [Candidatus Aminicenantes bacterium]